MSHFKTISIREGGKPTIYINYLLPFRFAWESYTDNDKLRLWDSRSINISLGWFRIWISWMIPGPATDRQNKRDADMRKRMEAHRRRRERQTEMFNPK